MTVTLDGMTAEYLLHPSNMLSGMLVMLYLNSTEVSDTQSLKIPFPICASDVSTAFCNARQRLKAPASILLTVAGISTSVSSESANAPSPMIFNSCGNIILVMLDPISI